MTATVTLRTSQLRDLLAPIIPFTAGPDTLPVLECIHVESRGDYLYATGTDRYRLGVQRVRPDTTPPEGLAFLLRRATARAILAMHKAGRANPVIEVTVAGDALTITVAAEQPPAAVAWGGATATTWPLGAVMEYPKTGQLVIDAAAAAVKGVAPAALNAAYLADFRHAIPPNSGEVLQIWGQDGKPCLVRVGDDFIGLIQPARVIGTAPLAALSPEWVAALAPAPKARRARATTRKAN